MKNITKSITGTIIGTVALMLAACSSNPSTAPEASAAIGQEDSSKQIRLEPTDSTSVPLIVSAETEETLESWLKSNPISNMIHVDYYCGENPDFPDNPHWCLPGKIQLESGTVLSLYSGTANAILCAADQDTILYSVHLHNNIISKRWSNPFFGIDFYSDAKDEFKRSCKAENGDITEDTEHKIACDIKIMPIQSPIDSSNQSPQYLLPHLSYNYEDPSWTIFATKTVKRCRIRPQIEPIWVPEDEK